MAEAGNIWVRLEDIRRQAEYEATLQAFDRWAARRAARRRFLWFAPWPRASVRDWPLA